ncbi:MAG: DUF4411 family protein [Sediminibacterium sp.]|nr:DUF4411 family protein [Sediminibacterium sp.]
MSLFIRYCLDTNVLIQAWQKYYSPDICPSYWERINEFGAQGLIFLPAMVAEEIHRTEDDLSKWLKTSKVPVQPQDGQVGRYLSSIFNANPNHKFLVDSTRQRSLADPWVIAHAMNEGATVVTKEEKITAVNTNKIRIPNVCEHMGVRCINDFEFIREIGLSFECTRIVKE